MATRPGSRWTTGGRGHPCPSDAGTTAMFTGQSWPSQPRLPDRSELRKAPAWLLWLPVPLSVCLSLSLPLSLSVSLFFWGSCPHACPPPAVVGPPIHPLISAQGPHTPGWSWLRPLPFYTVLIPVSSSLDVAAPFPVPWPRFQSVSQAGGCPQAGAAAALKLPPCRWPHGPLGQLAGSGPPPGRPACDQPLITPRPVGPAVHSSPGSLCLSVIHHWGPRPWTQQAGLCVGNRHSPQEPHTMLPNDAPHTGTGSRDALKAAF